MVREKWIDERGDTEILSKPASVYARERHADPKLKEMRFDLKCRPRCGKNGANVTQMHLSLIHI